MISKTIASIFLVLLANNSYAQVKKATVPVRKAAVIKQSVVLRPVKQWWWGYTGREIRSQVLSEPGWHSVPPSDTCKFCTAFADGFTVRMEFAFNPEGLWRRTWKIPRDNEAAQQWDNWFKKTSPPTFNGAAKNIRIVEGDGEFNTWLWRDECGDFIIYTAVASDQGGEMGPGFIRFRDLIDCQGNVVR